MAQVYSFVDDNGVTRLFAEIHPDPAGTPFNGGTITNALTVDTAATTDQALELTGTRTSENDVFRIDYPHTVMIVDSDGVASITSNDGMDFTVAGDGGRGNLHVKSNVASYADTNIGSQFGVRVTGVGTSIALLELVTAGGVNAFIVACGTDGYANPVLIFHMNVAPADGDLAAGDCALWFDQTNGAAKLMVKAKQADGTVRTGSLALT